MENHISAQLLSLFLAAALGMALGIFYDLLRALRLRRRKSHVLTHLMDGAFVLIGGTFSLFLALQVGRGELRLYLLAGLVSGALLWFSLPSAFFRPLWDWWLDTLGKFFRLLWCPVRYLFSLWQKFTFRAKKMFSFLSKYATIKLHRWRIILFHRKRKEGRPMAKPTARKRRTSPLLLLLLLVLILIVAVKIFQVYTNYNALAAEEAALAEKEETLSQENSALRSDLAKKDDPAFWEQLARKIANMVKPGERIFVDPNY